MFFANEQRDNVREENPGITFGTITSSLSALSAMLINPRELGQVGKVLGERWKALNSKQREPYEAKAKTDKQRYEDEKASYNVREHCRLNGVVKLSLTRNSRPMMRRKTRSRIFTTCQRPSDSLTDLKGITYSRHLMVVVPRLLN